MARPRNKLADYLTYFALRSFAMWVHMFPPEKAYRYARLIGELLWRLDRRHRRIAVGHIRLSFPKWPEARVRRVARKSMAQMVYLGLELLLTPRLITPMTWRQHVRFAPGMEEALRLLIRQHTGVILWTGHLGSWEIAGYTLATIGFPLVAVARPLDNPHINEFVMGVRERTGQSILYKKGAAGNMADVLDGRGILGIIGDQDAGQRGVFVDFFGRPASTNKSTAVMAVRTGCPIAVGCGQRISDRFEFEIVLQRIIYPKEWADKPDPVVWITQEYMHELEKLVERAPEQYLWVHRRWKHRPDGTKAGGDGVA